MMLVHSLIEVTNIHTSSGVQPTTASVTPEVLCFLMTNENIQVIEVAFAVIAPRARKDVFELYVGSFLLRHFAWLS